MIRQVTDGPHINHPTYFLQSSFFPGDREMFFTSYRTGDADSTIVPDRYAESAALPYLVVGFAFQSDLLAPP